MVLPSPHKTKWLISQKATLHLHEDTWGIFKGNFWPFRCAMQSNLWVQSSSQRISVLNKRLSDRTEKLFFPPHGQRLHFDMDWVPKKMSRPLHLPPSVILDPSANRTVTCKKVLRVVYFWPYYWNEKTFDCQDRKSLFSCPNSIVSSARGTFTWVKTSEWSETQPHKNSHKLSFTRE